MNIENIIGDYKEIKIENFDGSTKKIFYTEIETECPVGKLIVSTTDIEGNITNVNKSFIEMSGYTEEELIGTPHYILRHPDMPKAAFKDLWDTINSGEKWQGIVKNLRKDGGYYWVKATVIPNIRNGKLVSYTSVRRTVSKNVIESSIEAYKTL
jgi:aerotaxis receptor